MRYPKHVKGHITVFPNNVQELVTNVLPHPLLKVMDEIHVSWQGLEKQTPSDLLNLLLVRHRVVERVLVWLKRNNPLYGHIYIDTVEMDIWDVPVHGVPSQVYDRLERNEPSAWKKARTSHLVPPTERGLEDAGPVDIREVLAALNQSDLATKATDGTEQRNGPAEDGGDGKAEVDCVAETIYETASSGMFALDARPDIKDVEKLQYICASLGRGAAVSDRAGGGVGAASSAEERCGHAFEPYIAVSRSEEFADSFDTWFFAKTFPALFPFGYGGPRQAEESIADTAEAERVDLEAEATARSLVSS